MLVVVLNTAALMRPPRLAGDAHSCTVPVCQDHYLGLDPSSSTGSVCCKVCVMIYVARCYARDLTQLLTSKAQGVLSWLPSLPP